MNALVERWPGTARIPRIMLTGAPTPVAPMTQLGSHLEADVWVKRDDVTAPRYGGNKVRKLEYVLADARAEGADTLITLGALGSHHVLATSLYGREQGFDVHAVLLPEPYNEHVEQSLRVDLGLGAKLRTAPNRPHAFKQVAELAVRLRLLGQRPYLIPLGGSTPHGALGYVSAGVELAAQIDAGACPDPDAVFVACGSAATAAGLALGLAAAGVKTKVVAVRVTDKFSANGLKLRSLLHKAEDLLRAVEPRFPKVARAAADSLELDDVELGRGYARPTPSSEAARSVAREEGLTLDVTYTSKALASLVRHAEGARRGKRLLFWHTLSSAPLEPLLARAPQVPESLIQVATLPAGVRP